jgi:hypothetical protein
MALVALALAGCSIGGGHGGNETATAEVESTAAALAESPTPEVLTESSPVRGTTSAEETNATPGAATPTPAIVVSAPPVVIPTPRPSAATPTVPGALATPIVSPGGAAVGDGTGGPMAVAGVVGTPSAAATPVTGAAVTVTSCDVPEYPPYTGDNPTQLTTSDVNFRAGPGTDCAPIGEPIGAGVPVEVLSDPVVREGEEFTWVAVSLDGEQGWLATDFLEPAAP